LTQVACPGLRQSYGIGDDGAAVLLTAVGDNLIETGRIELPPPSHWTAPMAIA